MVVSSTHTEWESVLNWLVEARKSTPFQVRQIPLSDVAGWHYDAVGNLAHDSGAFFTVEGLDVKTDPSWIGEWSQPIINQNEVGLLGFLTRRTARGVEVLVQAKAEPGNVGGVQLAPTVQATRSNYSRAHGGDLPPYLDHFQRPRGQIVADTLQSEQGSRFLRKRNRNMIVEVDEHVHELEGFRWVSLATLFALLQYDSVVNMDARSVLSCLPVEFGVLTDLAGGPDALRDAGNDPLLAAFMQPHRSARPTPLVRSWLASARQTCWMRARSIPLPEVRDWRIGQDEIARDDGRFFRVIGAEVSILGREVESWSQPMVAPSRTGLAAFVVREIDDVLHVLTRTTAEAGLSEGVEIGPTVQGALLDADRRRELDFIVHVLDGTSSRVLFSTLLSEEGGRFYREENRYSIVRGDDFVDEEPPGFMWVTPAQLMEFIRYTGMVNVAARSLLACLMSLVGDRRSIHTASVPDRPDSARVVAEV